MAPSLPCLKAARYKLRMIPPMSLLDFGKSIAKYAPLLGAALPIPGGQILGQVIADTFQGDIKNPKDLLEKIAADKQANRKLQLIEANHQLEIEKLVFADRESAREREIKYIEKTGQKDYTLKNLAYITTIGFFTVLFILFLPVMDINDQEKNLIMVLLGMLASKWQTIIDFYFGASRDNNKK